MPRPKLNGGKLQLLESWRKSEAGVAWPIPTNVLVRTVEVSFDLTMNTGTEGMGMAWLNESEGPSVGEGMICDRLFEEGVFRKSDEEQQEGDAPGWECPSIAGSFGVGFDAKNPVNRDMFHGSGNYYDRPQHEVSLHWNGVEIVKCTTGIDFRDGEEHAVCVRIEFVVGGAEVSVQLGEDEIGRVYDKYFIPGMQPYVGQPVFGAHNSETAGDVLLDNVSVVCRGVVEKPEDPLRIVAFDRTSNDQKHKETKTVVDFPKDTDPYGRIIMTLRLDEPEKGFDPWDRLAHIYLFDNAENGAGEGERFELLRYITPYGRGHEWSVDVSDFRPLLRGRKRLMQECQTYGSGWLVSVRFDFYPGPSENTATKVINLWSGRPEIGNPQNPEKGFYVPYTCPIDEHISGAKVRMVVTGHGMSPNTGNAAEFLPIGRTLTVNGDSFRNRLWKTDNYLNPCRPQGGTWKYDRAGWAPGDVVRPWEIDISHLLGKGRELMISYELDEYLNKNAGKTSKPMHVTETQLILFK